VGEVREKETREGKVQKGVCKERKRERERKLKGQKCEQKV
jgi:hypothetical protein